jgi:hypothetical protein
MDIQTLKTIIDQLPRSPGGRRQFSSTVKHQIITLKQNYPGPINEFCKILNINYNQLIKWQHRSNLKKERSPFKKIIIESPAMAEATITVTGPLGLKIQGSPEDLARLLRSLLT